MIQRLHLVYWPVLAGDPHSRSLRFTSCFSCLVARLTRLVHKQIEIFRGTPGAGSRTPRSGAIERASSCTALFVSRWQAVRASRAAVSVVERGACLWWRRSKDRTGAARQARFRSKNKGDRYANAAIILAVGSLVTAALQRETRMIRIVFVNVLAGTVRSSLRFARLRLPGDGSEGLPRRRWHHVGACLPAHPQGQSHHRLAAYSPNDLQARQGPCGQAGREGSLPHHQWQVVLALGDLQQTSRRSDPSLSCYRAMAA